MRVEKEKSVFIMQLVICTALLGLLFYCNYKQLPLIENLSEEYARLVAVLKPLSFADIKRIVGK